MRLEVGKSAQEGEGKNAGQDAALGTRSQEREMKTVASALESNQSSRMHFLVQFCAIKIGGDAWACLDHGLRQLHRPCLLLRASARQLTLELP